MDFFKLIRKFENFISSSISDFLIDIFIIISILHNLAELTEVHEHTMIPSFLYILI